MLELRLAVFRRPSAAYSCYCSGFSPADQGKKAPLDPRRLVVSGSVTLSKSDIIGIHEEVGQFKVENNGDLFFDEDVDREALQCIEKIYNKGKLLVPKNVHPITLIKIGHVQGEVKKY